MLLHSATGFHSFVTCWKHIGKRQIQSSYFTRIGALLFYIVDYPNYLFVWLMGKESLESLYSCSQNNDWYRNQNRRVLYHGLLGHQILDRQISFCVSILIIFANMNLSSCWQYPKRERVIVNINWNALEQVTSTRKCHICVANIV